MVGTKALRTKPRLPSCSLRSAPFAEHVPGGASCGRYVHLPAARDLLPDHCAGAASTRNDEQLVNGEGIDIVLCLDISGSMLAQDFTPNRMEAAKNVASEFIDNRPTDRIGLVIFSGEAFTMCPLTTDRNVLKTQLFNVSSGLLEDGTAIGSGLATGVDRLRNSPSKTKVIILLTDGENNGGLIDPNTAKEIAKSVGVRVYTVGMGTEGFAPVPVQTPGGIVMQREKSTSTKNCSPRSPTRPAATTTAPKTTKASKNIYSEIDHLEKSKIEVSSIRRYTEEFFPFALAASISPAARTPPSLDRPAKVPVTLSSHYAGKSIQIHRLMVCRQNSRRHDLERPAQRHLQTGWHHLHKPPGGRR
jgi:Ca-activated chloride channel family protein